MRRVWQAVGATSLLIWESGVLQQAARLLLQWMHALLAWCVSKPMAVVGGLVALALAHLFASVVTTRLLMNAAFGHFGMLIFYFVIVLVGVLAGAGVIELRPPQGRR